MAKVFDEICRHNDIKDKTQMHNLNIFMSRLLFCFFAEDTHLFPEDNLFTNSIRNHTAPDGHDLADFIDNAFLAMSTNDRDVINALPNEFSVFPYVNGGLFEKRLPIPVLSRRARDLMIKCGEYDWRKINPDIFGSMIQAVVTPEIRAGLGMHYTSVPNITKLIRPLFLDELQEEYEVAKNTKDRKRLRALLLRLDKMKFFDPACGSGNFLIVSYKCIRKLEILILEALQKLGESCLLLSAIDLQQFYGIEIDDFACDTATLSLWLAKHQMDNAFEEKFGVRPNALPLRPSGHIVCGNACRLDWNVVCPHTKDEEVYVMGNPPYLGSKLQDEIQKEDMGIAMEGTSSAKTLDYIGAWFWKGAKYIHNTNARYAFVTTNSISQGEQVAMLWKPIFELGLVINFGRTSFKWSNNAKNNAAVTCAIIGVSNKYNGKRRFFDEKNHTEAKVDNINPYLTVGDNVIVEKRNEIPFGLNKACFGCMAYDHGNLILTEQEKQSLIISHPEVLPLIKRLIGSQEFIQDTKRFCLWIDDSELELALSIPEIKARIDATYEFRTQGADAATEDLITRSHQFREYFKRDSDAIIIPRVSSERREYIPMGFVDKDTVISDSAFAIYDAQMWSFAILTSKMHNLWVRAVGGSLETRIRYSATLCYNTFPFPKLNDSQKHELETLAQTILDIRDQHFDMTLGEMYNPESMPGELKEAHHDLDLAVERCYRQEPFTTDEERLEYLFKLYVKMIKK
jgi:type II restriction/modification system DNA methylase subunit YeeA